MWRCKPTAQEPLTPELPKCDIIANLEAHYPVGNMRVPPSHPPFRSHSEQPSPPGDQVRPRTSPSQTVSAVYRLCRWRFRIPVPPPPTGTERTRVQGWSQGASCIAKRNRTSVLYTFDVSISGTRSTFNQGVQDVPPASRMNQHTPDCFVAVFRSKLARDVQDSSTNSGTSSLMYEKKIQNTDLFACSDIGSTLYIGRDMATRLYLYAP